MPTGVPLYISTFLPFPLDTYRGSYRGGGTAQGFRFLQILLHVFCILPQTVTLQVNRKLHESIRKST